MPTVGGDCAQIRSEASLKFDTGGGSQPGPRGQGQALRIVLAGPRFLRSNATVCPCKATSLNERIKSQAQIEIQSRPSSTHSHQQAGRADMIRMASRLCDLLDEKNDRSNMRQALVSRSDHMYISEITVCVIPVGNSDRRNLNQKTTGEWTGRKVVS